MLLGRISGKVTTTSFKFLVEGQAKKFDYVQVLHNFYDYVLCQIVEIEKEHESTTAHCQVIGYKDKDGKIKEPRIPFEPGTEVLLAKDSFIEEVIALDGTQGAYLGKLDGKDIKVHINLQRLLTKHVAVLAKSGAGKSYTVGVLLEEIIDKKIPLLIIDPHGEYSTLAKPTTQDSDELARYGITPQGYKVQEYGDTRVQHHLLPLRLSNTFTIQELLALLPIKLNNTQVSLLHTAAQQFDTFTLEDISYAVSQEESNAKWQVISLLEQLRSQELFATQHTPYHELLKPGMATIINGKGLTPETIDILCYKLATDLFHLRKQEKVPPFFMVIEEAHNFCPERSFGEKKSSKILRTIASEGRKFGLGLCVVSQRPARVDKSVLSQCSTQIIMKVTNPNDIKTISQSVEGMTQYTESELSHIAIGTALVTGVTDVPLFVNIRPRRSLHGGHAIDMLDQGARTAGSPVSSNATATHEYDSRQEVSLTQQIEEFNEKEILPLITQNHTKEDAALMLESDVATILLPVYTMNCRNNDETFTLLIDATTGAIITDKTTNTQKKLPRLYELDKQELHLLQFAFSKPAFTKEQAIGAFSFGIEKKIEQLLQKGLLEEWQGKFRLSPDYIYAHLERNGIYESFAYAQVAYDVKKEPRFSLDECIALLQKFTQVIDHSQGFLVVYETK